HQTIRLWDVQKVTHSPALGDNTESVSIAKYSPDGHHIASANGFILRLWDAETGAPGPIMTGHAKDIRDISFSPNGEQIASGSCDETVRLWDAQTGVPGH